MHHADPEAKKIDEEFEEYQRKVKEQKEQWAKEHPDEVKPDDDDWDNWYGEGEKELQQIFQVQSASKEIMMELDRKMNDIIARQENVQQSIAALKVLTTTSAFIYTLAHSNCMKKP